MTGQAGNNGGDSGGGAVDGVRRDTPRGDAVRRDTARRDTARRDTARRDTAGGQRDLTDDIQRWLVRSGVRSMRRELTDQVRRAFHAGRPAEPADVWDAATTEPPPELMAASGDAPECAWCPVCRAARRIRESGQGVSGLGVPLAGAGDAVAAAVQEAFSAFESLLGTRPRGGDGFPEDRYPAGQFPADRFRTAGTPAADTGGKPAADTGGKPAADTGGKPAADTRGTPPRDADHGPDDRS